MRVYVLFLVLSLISAASHATGVDAAVFVSIEETKITETGFKPSMPDKKEVNQLSTYCYFLSTGEIIPNCTITVKVKPVSGSGGHAHNSATRSAGSVSPASGNSGTTGIFKFTYTSPEVSGRIEMTVTGYKPGYTFNPGVGQFPVEVKGLVPLGAGTDYNLVGQTTSHPVNHYAVPGFNQKLISLAKQYRQAFPGSKLNFNDMSLVSGGVFDLNGTWKPPHAEHRIGFSEDLRLVPAGQRAKLELIIKSLGLGIHKEEAKNHWHIRFDPRGRL